MKHRHGFTIVELVITITIMAILMTVGVVALRSTQVNGRDEERKTDVADIALGLQSFYQESRPAYGMYGEGSSYPNLIEIASEKRLREMAPTINASSLRAPGVVATAPISLVAATNDDETTAGIQPQPTTSTYVYQPLTSQRQDGPYLRGCPSSGVGNKRSCMRCDGSFSYPFGATVGSDGSISAPADPNPPAWSKQPCARFNLFYRLEADNTVYKVMSKDQ